MLLFFACIGSRFCPKRFRQISFFQLGSFAKLSSLFLTLAHRLNVAFYPASAPLCPMHISMYLLGCYCLSRETFQSDDEGGAGGVEAAEAGQAGRGPPQEEHPHGHPALGSR